MNTASALVVTVTTLGCANSATVPKATPAPSPTSTMTATGANATPAASSTAIPVTCDGAHLEACAIACQTGDARACFMAATGFRQAAVPDRARAFAADRKGCDLGYIQCCGNLGLMYEKGWGTGRDLQQASALYERACVANEAIACRNIGKLYEGVDGLAPDPEKSGAAYRRALELALAKCDAGKAEGCAAAGYMYEDGKGAAKDDEHGAALVSKACTMGYSWACRPRVKD